MRCEGEVLYDDDKVSQVVKVEKYLNIEASDSRLETMTAEDLKIPGEMFMFLILCPDSFRPWMVFYKDLLKNKSADQLLLTLNRIMKGSKANGNIFIHDLAREIFMKIHSSITIPKNFEKDGILIN